MGSHGVVVDPPCFDETAGFGQRLEDVFVQAFVSTPAIKLPQKPFCIGFPGAM